MKTENLGRKEYINDDLHKVSRTDIYFPKCIKLKFKAKEIPERDILCYRKNFQTILKVFHNSYVVRKNNFRVI